jgi:hypothetical protein
MGEKMPSGEKSKVESSSIKTAFLLTALIAAGVLEAGAQVTDVNQEQWNEVARMGIKVLEGSGVGTKVYKYGDNMTDKTDVFSITGKDLLMLNQSKDKVDGTVEIDAYIDLNRDGTPDMSGRFYNLV